MLTLTERSFFQPTLALYLGGSGILVGDRLLTMLEELPEEGRGWIETFFIDSQQPSLADHERTRHYFYTDLGMFYQPIFRELVLQRFPDNLGEDPVVNSSQGCGVTRIFGAASLVAWRDDFAALLEQGAARLRQRRAFGTQPLQVFLTASACGGTGAGMLLDAAAMVRHVLRRRLGETPRISLFLLGPRAFFEDPTIRLTEEQRDRMSASTYALLKELHQFAEQHPFVSAYRLRDEVVRIENDADDDRLFDWVYLVDGRTEGGGPSRSVAEVAWTVAEAQLHLCATEVGRKISDLLPNQREERVRKYPLNFVHPDNKERLTPSERQRLDISSRTTFLASLATRNVRFPAEPIKEWFRWGWVCETLEKILLRAGAQEDGGLAAATGAASIDQLDRLLGLTAGRIGPDGLLAELGLGAGPLGERAAELAGGSRALPGPLRTDTPPERLQEAQDLLAQAARLLAELEEPATATRPSPGAGDVADARQPAADAAAATLARWSAEWSGGLAAGGVVAGRLWQLAWDPVGGRGLRWLDTVVVHAATTLDGLAHQGMVRPDLGELRARVDDASRRFAELRNVQQKEERSMSFRARTLASRLWGEGKRPYRQAIRTRTTSLLRLLNALRDDLLGARSRHLEARFVPRVWQEGARLLRRWRDDVLLPTVTAAGNGLTLAGNRRALAREALRWHQGANRRGEWRAESTVQIAGDDLLQAFARRLESGQRVRVEDLALRPLQGEGISSERYRLTVETLRETERDQVVAILYGHLQAATRGVLAFLDDGWRLAEAAERLHTVGAKTLDQGSEPLLSFARAAVGLQTHTYLLKPRDVILPVPFGRTVGQGNSLASRDPLQLGVVSFVYGIPPSSLADMRELFLQYTVHLGDQAWHRGAHDRYPLHVFREAAEGFDEPYSPLSLEASEDFLRNVLQAARELGILNGRRRARLDIRSFDGSVGELLGDTNRAIELTEKVLHRLEAWPRDADDLFARCNLSELARLFRGGRYRAAAAATADGDAAGSIH